MVFIAFLDILNDFGLSAIYKKFFEVDIQTFSIIANQLPWFVWLAKEICFGRCLYIEFQSDLLIEVNVYFLDLKL